LVTVHQIHSPDVVVASEAWPQDERPRADAMVTDTPNLLLGILTADCAPVLFADHKAVVVGAAHAGWRGALAGVTDATIEAMEKLGARRENIHAAVGPCIAQPSYEVDEAFRARFLHADPDNARFFVDGSSGKPHFDLEAYVVHRLIAAGIDEIEAVNLDTYAEPDRFFSYRRSTHRGEADYGRQLSAIAIPG
jgi:YfiH family protein